MMEIIIKEHVGNFAENKDIAKKIRLNIEDSFDKGKAIIIDFKSVDSTTQSFIHALISKIFQNQGELALEKFEFRNCNKPVKSLITTVINYSLE